MKTPEKTDCGGQGGIEPLLTSGELCAVLRIDRPRLYALIDAGVIRGIRLGRRWRFAPTDVRAFLAGGGKGLNAGWRNSRERIDG